MRAFIIGDALTGVAEEVVGRVLAVVLPTAGMQGPGRPPPNAAAQRRRVLARRRLVVYPDRFGTATMCIERGRRRTGRRPPGTDRRDRRPSAGR